jgi:hypothetical protein
MEEQMNLHDEIAMLAHEIYQRSGCIPYRELENWLEAEMIVLARHASQDIEEPDEPLFIEEIEVTVPIIIEEAGIAEEEGITARAKKGKPSKKVLPVKKETAKGKKEAPKKGVSKVSKKAKSKREK